MGADFILPVRMRADLVIVPYRSRYGRWWTVKDPLALRYFRIRDEEMFVLRRLDGRTAATTILCEFQQHFAPHRLAIEELALFVQRLAAQHLVTTDSPTRLGTANRRHRKAASRRLWSRIANPLALQWRGVDPQRFLNWLHSFLWWLFSPWLLGAGMALIVAALALIVGHWEEFQIRLPAASSVLAPTNLIWIAVAIAVVKVLHELGHALTCRHLGGECHELGLMLLVFVPCLYCNVSDGWLFPNKWQRMAVSAAGICVELVLAALCTFLWWYSEPGPFHSLCASIMIVASTGTLLLNANPLLRYDGYYAFADLVEVPNLRRRAMSAWHRYCAGSLFGVAEPAGDVFDRGWAGAALAAFGFASLLYSWFVMFVILWFLDGALQPYGLRPLAAALAILVVGTRLTGMSVGATRQVVAWNAAGQLQPARFIGGCAVLALAAGFILATPLPHRVAAPFVIAPRAAEPIYVSIPGKLATGDTSRVRYGDRVSAGQVVAVLESHAIEREISRLHGECHHQKIVVEGLRRQHSGATGTAAQLSSARAMLADLEQQLQQRLRDRDSLLVQTPREGVLLPPSAGATLRADRLQSEGHPLDNRNSQMYLETGALIGVVGTPGRFDALLVVDQTDLPYVRPGQPVRLQLPEGAEAILTGVVTEIATRSLERSPPALVATQRLPSRIGNDGNVQPLRTAYEVRAEVDEVPGFLAVDAAGEARIDVGTMTLARRIVRWFEATFARDR